MTAPRQILSGTTYLVTRRCVQRQFLLNPSKLTNAVFLYVLAVAAQRYGIEVHAYCVLSNHYHLVVTDPLARLPAFHQLLDALVARAMNAWHRRSEAFWAPNSYSAVTLAEPADIVAKSAYTLANPVAAGLVRSGRSWPGLWSAPERIGAGRMTIARPTHFFDPKGSLPAEVTLELTVPPGFDSPEEFQEALKRELGELEASALANRSARDVVGVAAVLAQKPTARPSTRERPGGLNPRVAARDKWKRIEVLSRLADFLSAYRDAWTARAAGDTSATFPAGTYLMRVLHGAPCAGFC